MVEDSCDFGSAPLEARRLHLLLRAAHTRCQAGTSRQGLMKSEFYEKSKDMHPNDRLYMRKLNLHKL